MQCINHLATVAIPHNIHIDYCTTPRVLEMWEKSIDELTKCQASDLRVHLIQLWPKKTLAIYSEVVNWEAE